MQLNPECKPYFHNWVQLSGFENNNDTWTAPCDGFISIVLNQNVSTTEYAYIFDGALGMYATTLVIPNGPQGYAYSNSAPVQKNRQYTLQTNVSNVYITFMPYDV